MKDKHAPDLDFPERLLACLRSQGISQNELARRLGVDRGTVSRWGAGLATPSFSTLQRMALELGVTLEFLVTGKDRTRPAQDLSKDSRPIPLVGATAAVTGWRTSEILSRRWCDVEGGFLLLRPGETKNGRGRSYPLDPELAGILAGLPRGGPGERIFAIRPGGLRSAWDRARAAAGLPHRLMHDLRRTAARDLIRSGVDRDTARRLLGHETDSIFSRYRIVAGDDLKEAAGRLAAYRKKAATRTTRTKNRTNRTSGDRETAKSAKSRPLNLRALGRTAQAAKVVRRT